MADWTLSAASVFRPYRSPTGSPQIGYFQCSTAASTALIKAGQVVQQDTVVSTGGFRISRAKTTSSNALCISTRIIGIAAESDASDGSTSGLSDPSVRNIGIFVADAETEFWGHIHAGATASSYIGMPKGIMFDSTLGIFLIDSTNSTTALLNARIVDVPPGTVGDTNGPLVFKFIPAWVSEAVR